MSMARRFGLIDLTDPHTHDDNTVFFVVAG